MDDIPFLDYQWIRSKEKDPMKSIFSTLMITLFATSAVAPVGAKEFYLGFGIGPMGALKSGYPLA